MLWTDVAMILFVCVMAIHMELVDAILGVLRITRRVPIITCPKCAVFWSVLFYALCKSSDILLDIATSFLASYLAVWFDLYLGYMQNCYEKIYKEISKEESGATTEVHHKNNRKRKGKDVVLPKV